MCFEAYSILHQVQIPERSLEKKRIRSSRDELLQVNEQTYYDGHWGRELDIPFERYAEDVEILAYLSDKPSKPRRIQYTHRLDP